MKNNFWKWTKRTAITMAMLTLVACSTDNEEIDDGTKGDLDSTELSGDITFWHSFTQGPRFESINQSARDFESLHPDVNITVETFSWDDFYTKWTTGLSSGNVPDLSTAFPGQVVEMIDAGALRPMDDVIDNIGRNRFSEAAIFEGTVEDINYSLPLYSHAQVMWYRKDLLEENNLDIPETWDQLAEAAEVLTGDGNYGLSVPTGANDVGGARFLNFYVRSRGESLLTEDLQANLTSPVVLDGINYWVDMYNTSSPQDSIGYNILDQATLFYQGKTAFDFNSGFHIGGVAENSPELLDDIAAAPIPKYNTDDPDYGIETSNIPLVVWENAEHPDVTKAFVEFLFEDDRYIDFLAATPVGMLPALNDIYENEEYLDNETIQKFSEEVDIISEAIDKGTAIGFENGPSLQAGYLTSQGIIENMFQDIIVNGTDVKKAAENAEKELNDIYVNLPN